MSVIRSATRPGETKRIKPVETTTRYRPAPPNRMHQNCRIPYTNAHQRISTVTYTNIFQTFIWTKNVRNNRRKENDK
ncbi:uncharacterized protein BO72DRAFT_44338 [Aspergillus fijiensis CBS 313.89]|uniref:Uncharacterized protein n=1 Tax=Aspergillus fijiensis CBS 313.89 TaxID=1448319 RepID=A0A8G1RZ37_9EURO|nr:uncharacterized protein BO72DRAFT_44338 [Aspergillus fijiensis CBS 313.89]RAK79431.1 hypothetical protein BO72DRAFT_44338 [Aspergillus fijiensis CBS 313.89]